MAKINPGHYLELMDRLHIVMSTIHEHCLEHPVAKKDKRINSLLNKAIEDLWDAYQIVGELEHKKDNNTIY